MNSSSTNVTLGVRQQDSFSKALAKNLIVVLLGISINYINVNLIYTFRKHQILHRNPRYILFIHMVVNDMTQMTISITLLILTYTIRQISVSVCSGLILITLFTTENTPLNLACMVLECYIAICMPLHHVRICTVRRARILIGLIWATTIMSTVPDLFVTLATEPPSFFHSRVLCVRQAVFPHPVLFTKREISYSFFLTLIWLAIFFSYFKILFAAKTASKDAKKARNTIILHGIQVLLCMNIYVGPQVLSLLQKTFLLNNSDLLFGFYITVQILPRSISPIIYGVRDNTFRKYLKRYLLCKFRD